MEKVEAQLAAGRLNPNDKSETYSINQFAEALGCNRQTVKRRIDDGAISAFKIGKYWKIPKSELSRIFEEGMSDNLPEDAENG